MKGNFISGQLKKAEDTKSNLNKTSVEIEDAYYLCSICDLKFPAKLLLFEHCSALHSDTVDNFCKICQLRFSTESILKIHNFVLHPDQEKSSPCERINNSPANEQTKDRTSYVCSNCGARFLHKNLLIEHMKDHIGDGTYENLRRGDKISNVSDLKIHLSAKQRTDKESLGELAFSSNALLKAHHRQYASEFSSTCSSDLSSVINVDKLSDTCDDSKISSKAELLSEDFLDLLSAAQSNQSVPELRSLCSPALSQVSNHKTSQSSSDLPPVTKVEVSNPYHVYKISKTEFLSDDLLVNDLPSATHHNQCTPEFRSRNSLDSPQVSRCSLRSNLRPVASVDEVSNCCYECSVCKAQFLSKDLLVQHVNDFPCASFYSQSTSDFHCQSSLDSNEDQESDSCSYVCDVREAQLFSKDLLAQHISEHSNDSQAGASFCKTKLQFYTQKIDKRYECSFCSMKFQFPSLLKYHTCVHTSEKPYERETCSRKFTHRNSLAHHKVSHDGNSVVEEGTGKDHARYNCPKCTERFSTIPKLKSHLLERHSVKCVFTCTSCDVVFVSVSNLRKHHNKCAPEMFSCDFCEARFCNKRSLRVHLMKHKVGKRFECGVCQMKFQYKYLLTEHLAKHTKERNFKCSKCGRMFSYKSSLRVHHNQAHGDGSGMD